MPATKIGSADYTDMSTIAEVDPATTTFQWEVTKVDTDAATGEKEYTFTNTHWSKWLGYYHSIPKAASSIDRKASWTVGQGFTFRGNPIKRFTASRRLGMGKDTFTTILYNLDRAGSIGGDVFAEKIKDESGRLNNLKPLNPGRMKIVVDPRGMIKRYEQGTNVPGEIIKFEPEEIFHIPFNRIADEVHGLSEFIAIEDSIKMGKEAKLDLKKVFHRYVKPLIISVLDTDDATEIAAFKKKLDKVMELGENLIIPKDTVQMERMSIPQYSTLDPLPWIRNLDKEQSLYLGTPEIVMGMSEDTTEAASKMVYLSYEVFIKFRQVIWQEAIKSQLGFDIKLEFPASIQPDLLKDDRKDGEVNKKPNVNPAKHE